MYVWHDVEIATGSEKGQSEELNCCCYRIIHSGNLLLHLSCPLNILSDDNCFGSSVIIILFQL